MAYCGARRNEALALRWADVDAKGEKLTIERQAGGKDGKDGCVEQFVAEN
jgi:integrase